MVLGMEVGLGPGYIVLDGDLDMNIKAAEIRRGQRDNFPV